MTDRQAALAYGVTTACAVALVLLVSDYPSGRNLVVAILAGIVVGIGSWFWLDRR